MPRFVSSDGKQVIETEVPRESVQLRAEGFTQVKDSTAEAGQDNTAGTDNTSGSGEVEQTDKAADTSKPTRQVDKTRTSEAEQTDKSADTSKSSK